LASVVDPDAEPRDAVAAPMPTRLKARMIQHAYRLEVLQHPEVEDDDEPDEQLEISRNFPCCSR